MIGRCSWGLSSTLGLRLLKGSALNLVSVGFSQGSTLIVSVLLARMLGQESFGQYAITYMTLLTIAGVAQGALGYTATKYVAEYREQDLAKACRILGLGVVCAGGFALLASVVLYFGSGWVSTTILHAPHLKFALLVGVGFIFFSIFNGFQAGLLAGLEEFSDLAKAGVYSGLLNIGIIYVMAIRWHLLGALFGLSLASLVKFIIFKRYIARALRRHNLSFDLKNMQMEIPIFVKFTLPGFAMAIFSLPMVWLANTILVRQNDGYNQMALFSASNSMRILVLFAPQVIYTVGISIMNNEKGKKERRSYDASFKLNMLVIGGITFITILLMAILGNSFLHLFGRNYLSGKPILIILLLAALPEGLSIGIYQHIQAQEKLWAAFWTINFPREAILVVSSYFLVSRWNAIGLAVAYCIAGTYSLAAHLALYLKIRRLSREIAVVCISARG